MMTMFDKGLSIRMGQAHVKRWIPDLLPLVEAEDDPLGTMDLATHHVTLDEAPGAYRDFRAKNDGWSKLSSPTLRSRQPSSSPAGTTLPAPMTWSR